MKRKVIRVGNSYGILLPKSLLKVLEWEDESEVEADINLRRKRITIKRKR